MPVYNPHELSEFLSSLGRGAKRTLSQNFLIDGNIVRKIASLVHPTKDDIIIEIGPGPGALTETLLYPDETSGLEVPKHLIAIELDDEFAHHLPRFAEKKEEHKHLTVINSDVLKCDFHALLTPYLQSSDKKPRIKVVSNVPYHLTTEIIEHIFRFSDLIHSVTLMVQHEVAKKITSSSDSSSWLSLFVSYYADAEYAFFVPRGCFTPVPNVDSAVVLLKPFNRDQLLKKEDEPQFFLMLKHFFTMKRKTIAHAFNILVKDKPLTLSVLDKSGLSSTLRPEDLSCQDWKRLFTAWKESGD